MARDRNFLIARKEDIVSYEHNLVARTVTVLVGDGELDEDGNFVVRDGQNYERYEINGNLFNKLMAADEKTGKPAGVFRREDLWWHIDSIREEFLKNRNNGIFNKK